MRADEKFTLKKKWVKVVEWLWRINSVANIYKWWILNAGRYLMDFCKKMRGEKISGGWWRSQNLNFSFFFITIWLMAWITCCLCIVSLSFTKDINAKMLFNFTVRRCLSLSLFVAHISKINNIVDDVSLEGKKTVNEV